MEGTSLKRNIVIFLFLVVVISAMLIFGRIHSDKVSASDGKLAEGAILGKPAPDFALKTLDGQDFKLSDLRGKAVVLNFWATWCVPCKAEMPWFVDFQKDYGSQGLQVVGVAMDDSGKDEIEKFARSMGVNYPIVLGKESVGELYGGVQFLPTTFYIDRSGKIDNRVFGIVDRKEAEQSVKKVIASSASAPSAPAAPANTVPNSEVPNRSSQGAQH